MKHLKHTFLPLICAMAFVGCSDDAGDADRDVTFCVRAVWNNGFETRNTRADAGNGYNDDGSPSNDPTNNGPGINGNQDYYPDYDAYDRYILSENREQIVIPFEFYPASISLTCSNGIPVTLTKTQNNCNDHKDFLHYSADVIFRENQVKRDGLTFEAKAIVDPIFGRPGDVSTPNNPIVMSDVLEGECGVQYIDNGHMQLTLHHTKALVRFGFKVAEKYDKVRYVRIIGIKLNNSIDCHIVKHVLTTDGTMIAYAYIDPKEIDWLDGDTEVSCTYNIYDKDSSQDAYDATDNHLTRKAVTAKNAFKFGNLKKNGVSVSKIEAGYYYDVMVTINPDYLYVLAEHDDKHMKIE